MLFLYSLLRTCKVKTQRCASRECLSQAVFALQEGIGTAEDLTENGESNVKDTETEMAT